MQLATFQVTNFRSVLDSGMVSVGRTVCLVGKNEAGKTAILQALAGLNPHPATMSSYDVERDYPRLHLNAYQKATKDKEAVVVATEWSLDEAERLHLASLLGPAWTSAPTVGVSRRYGSDGLEWQLRLDADAILEHLYGTFHLDAAQVDRLSSKGVRTTSALFEALQAIPEPDDVLVALRDLLGGWPDHCATGLVTSYLGGVLPHFMYFSHYDRMAGQLRLDDIQSDTQGLHRVLSAVGPVNQYGHPLTPSRRQALSTSELVFIDFLTFTGTSLGEISASTTYESLNAKCESASNTITQQLLEYWTQNPFLEVEVRVTSAKQGDEAPFDQGTIARARIRNTLHKVTVPFSERSAGFIWFFSFLVKFSQIDEGDRDVVLLLDEPGLTLHGKAQADLLRYFNDRIVPKHQLVFSTHSPFMVPADDLTLSRIVEDQMVQERPMKFSSKGTKVRDDVLATDPDTLFPLQGALGYDVTQSLFIGKHTLLVEGPGDVLFLKALSAQMKRRKRPCLDPRWALCPAGGIDKVQSFVALFTGARLNLAVMTDFSAGDRRKLEQLKRSKVLDENRVMNFADTLGLPEADVEDIFAVELYLRMVNDGFELKGAQRLTASKLDKSSPPPGRLLKRVEAAFRLLPPEAPEFDHFTPADWLIRNPATLDLKDAEVEATLDRAEKVFLAINRHVAP